MIVTVEILAPDTWGEALAMKAAHPDALPIAGRDGNREFLIGARRD